MLMNAFSAVEQSEDEISFGCLTLKLEQAYLSKIDSEGIWKRLNAKINAGEVLTDEDQMEFIILPLAYKGESAKKQAVKESVELARKIQDKEKQAFILAGLLVFADKIIDPAIAEYIKEVLHMTQVAELLMEEGRQMGREEGLKAFIELCKEMKISKEDAIKRIETTFVLPVDVAKESLQKYWV